MGKEVVITEKMDGENTTLYRDYLHARSIDSPHHPSRDLIKRFHAEIAFNIPEGWRICGENMYARHSIAYNNLPHHFLGFSIWNEKNECLSWEETVEWFKLLGIVPVPVLYEGVLTDEVLKDIVSGLDLKHQEGFVIRVAGRFRYENFARCVAKYVRPNHIQTTRHWRRQKIIPNSGWSK